jgi:hypothetical protein
MDAEVTWTWVLFCFEIMGITGTFFVGRKQWWGWLIVLLHSIPWFVYSYFYSKPGFIAMSFMWWTMNFYNMVRWRAQSRVERDLKSAE